VYFSLLTTFDFYAISHFVNDKSQTSRSRRTCSFEEELLHHPAATADRASPEKRRQNEKRPGTADLENLYRPPRALFVFLALLLGARNVSAGTSRTTRESIRKSHRRERRNLRSYHPFARMQMLKCVGVRPYRVRARTFLWTRAGASVWTCIVCGLHRLLPLPLLRTIVSCCGILRFYFSLWSVPAPPRPPAPLSAPPPYLYPLFRLECVRRDKTVGI
jgi:hypothetical protein